EGGVHGATRVDGVSYRYNPKGARVAGPEGVVDYTSFDLPRTITNAGRTTRFQYDAGQHRAFKKTPDGASTSYAGELYEKRDDGVHVTHIFHVLGIADVEWQADRRGTILDRRVTYLHGDHLGSVTEVTGASAPTKHLRFDPFGKRIDPSVPSAAGEGPAGVTSGFAGLEHDDELGLVNMRGRMFDPKIGRFLSADPLIPNATTSQGFNRYSYVYN